MKYEGMLAETIRIAGHGDDEIAAYFARPIGSGPYAGVVVIHHMPGWDEATKKENRRRHLRQGDRINAQNLFTEINSHQAFLGLPPFLYPPERSGFDLQPLGPLVATGGRDGVRLKLGVPMRLAGHILIFGARPCSSGRRYCDKLRYICVIEDASRGVIDITARYCERLGMPWPGSRVIIATQQQLNGWRDIPRRLDVIVPEGKGPTLKPKPRRTPPVA